MLVFLYPASFRERYEKDVLASLRDVLEEVRTRSLVPKIVGTAKALVDFVVAGILERLTAIVRVLGFGVAEHPVALHRGFGTAPRLGNAIRSLTRNPVYSLVSFLTLALGIGAGASIFAVVNAVLLEPLPYPEPERIVTIWEQDLEAGPHEQNVAPPNFSDWTQQSETFAAMAAVARESFVLPGADGPTKVSGGEVTSDFFAVFATVPIVGRNLTSGDSEQGASPVVMISHGFWQRWFGGDAAAVGRDLEIDGGFRRVVGVLPESFEYNGPGDLWVPLVIPDDQLSDNFREARYLTVVGRLAADRTTWQAQQELTRIVHNARGEASERRWGVVVKPLKDHMVGDVATLLWLIMGAVGVLVVVVSANLANLGIARATARTNEMSVRLALGASRARIFVETLTENIVLCVAGGAMGLLVAAWAVRPLVAMAPVTIPRLNQVAVSWEVAGLVFSLALLIGFLLSLIATLRINYRSPALVLRGESGATSPGQRLRSGLIVSEISLSLALLILSGLLTKSFLKLASVDPGFVAEGVATGFLSLPDDRFPTDESKLSFFNDVLAAMETSPVVDAVGFSTNLPMAGSNMNFGFNLESDEDKGRGALVAEFHAVNRGYFEALSIPIVSGTSFSPVDQRGEFGPIIINETFARTYFPGRDPLDERIQIFSDEGYTWRTIVGVVGDLIHGGLTSDPKEEVYIPMQDLVWGFNNLVVKTAASPQELTAIVRNIVAELDPGLPVDPMVPFDRFIDRSLAPLRFQSLLFGLFAGASVTLSGIGLYGLIAFVVGSRTREFGIRVALGAQSGRVIRLVLGQGTRLMVGGLIIGLALAVGVSSLISGMLFEVTVADPAVFAWAVFGVALVSIGASLVPALRAGKTDPVKTLKTG